MYKYEEELVLRDLKLEQSGQYYCKTSSPAGAIKSSPSILTVIGKISSELKTSSASMTSPFLLSEDAVRMWCSCENSKQSPESNPEFS